MAYQALIAVFLFFASPAYAYVTVYSAHPTCKDLFNGQMSLQKITQGYRVKLHRDQTERAPERLSPDAYSTEVLGAVEKVRSVYSEIFQAMKMDPRQAEEILRQFAREDEERIAGSRAQNGLDNTVYFVNRSASGVPQSVVRATLIKAGDTRGLPLERYAKVPAGNRVELERAFNMPGARSGVIAGEMMTVLAKYFQEHFGSNDYTIYNLTDAPRARLYHRDYGFALEEQKQLEPMRRYLCLQSGKDFHFRYIGHINAAYRYAFGQMPYGSGKDIALGILESYGEMPGLREFIPNIVARSIISAAFRDYAKAIQLSDSLKSIGHAEINEDYYALWKSRVAFDPFEAKGNPVEALGIVDDYLSRQPLEVQTYNDRAMLFLVYRLKILLASEDFGAAKKLLAEHKALLLAGREKLQPVYGQVFKGIQGISDNQQRRTYLELMLDLSTHMDPFATSVLHEEAWRALATVESAAGRPDRAARYERIAGLVHDL